MTDDPGNSTSARDRFRARHIPDHMGGTNGRLRVYGVQGDENVEVHQKADTLPSARYPMKSLGETDPGDIVDIPLPASDTGATAWYDLEVVQQASPHAPKQVIGKGHYATHNGTDIYETDTTGVCDGMLARGAKPAQSTFAPHPNTYAAGSNMTPIAAPKPLAPDRLEKQFRSSPPVHLPMSDAEQKFWAEQYNRTRKTRTNP